jgi:hypothetical protein
MTQEGREIDSERERERERERGIINSCHKKKKKSGAR